MKLSVVIPAHNEAGCLAATLHHLHCKLVEEAIAHELVVVDDHSTDRTGALLDELLTEIPALVSVSNHAELGFGRAVRCGLERASGDAIALFMADESDRPEDLVRFFRVMESQRVDCVFGTRFSPESRVLGYPPFKLFLNRVFNKFIRLLFGLKYNDVTNAFKLYRREVIEGAAPLISQHFNLTVELPLKAIARGYRYAVVPNDWTNRRTGESKLRIREMGSRYLLTLLHCSWESFMRGTPAK